MVNVTIIVYCKNWK